MSADTIVFFENVMSIKKSEVILVENSEYLQLDVTGTANNFKINVYAQVTEDGDFLPLAIIGNSTFKIFNSITEKGFYRVDTSGILNIRVDLVEISNGTISCKGIIVNKDITVSTESDWEANEGEEGFIKNRTHWVENSFEPIIVDNITNGIISEETFDDNGLVFYRISEQALSEEQINGSTFGIELSNGNYGVSIIGEGVEETDGIAFCEFELVLPDGLVYGSLISSDNLDVTPTIGTYIAFYPVNFDQTTLKKIEFKNEVVHKLDRKFIPENEIFQISIDDLNIKTVMTLGKNYTCDISETLLETIKANKFLELTNVEIYLKNNDRTYKCNILTKFVDYSKFSESIYDYDGTYLISENLISLDEEKINLKIYLYKPEQNSVPQISIIANSAIESNVTEDDLVVKEGMSIGSVQSDNSIAGGKGYKLTAFTNNGDGTGVCTVRTTEGLAVNMEYSIRVANMFCKAGKITAINGLQVTIDGVPEKAVWEAEDAESPETYTVENYLTIVGRPELGDTDVGFNAIAVGEGNVAQDRASYTEGRQNKSIGQYAHTEGRQNIAGYAAHAEGRGNIAIGDMSHAEGHEVIASGNMAHAEGQKTTAEGRNSHAQGYYTESIGEDSHSEGCRTIAKGYCQHVQGAYNIEDDGTYLHIVGNGNSSKQSNAHTITWSGDGWFARALYIGGNNQFDGAKKVATEDMITTKEVHDGEGNHSVIVGGWRKNSEDYGAFGANSVVLGGYNNNASGAHSVVGGYESEAIGPVTFALGEGVKATANAAMAIGINTQANGRQAFAGGSDSIANGNNSFASGTGTIAQATSQFVFGKYNVADSSKAQIVGWGSGEDEKDESGNIITQKRKNIYTLDTTGNAEFAGTVKAGRTTTDEDDDLTLVNKSYVNRMFNLKGQVNYYYDLPKSEVKVGDAYIIRKDSSVDDEPLKIPKAYEIINAEETVLGETLRGIIFTIQGVEDWEYLSNNKESVKINIVYPNNTETACASVNIPIVYNNDIVTGIRKDSNGLHVLLLNSDFENYNDELKPLIIEEVVGKMSVNIEDEYYYEYDISQHIASAGDVAICTDVENNSWCILTTSEVVKKIPDFVGNVGSFIVSLTVDENGQPIADKTFEEIKTALDDNKNVYIKNTTEDVTIFGAVSDYDDNGLCAYWFNLSSYNGYRVTIESDNTITIDEIRLIDTIFGNENVADAPPTVDAVVEYVTAKTEDFTVEVTYTYDTKTVTANTAFADIQQAIISGKNVVLNLSFVYTGGLYIEDEKLILPLAAFYEDSRVVFATAQTNKIYTVSCRTGESWHFEESTIKEPSYVSQLLNTTSSSSVPTANAVVNYVDNKIGNMFNLKGSVDYYQDLPTSSDLKNGDAYRIEKDSSINPYRMVIHQVYNEQANTFQMTASGVEGIYFKFNDVENWDELVEGKTSIELIITDSGASNRHSTFSIPISQTLSYTNSCICKNGASIEAVIIKSEYENYDSELFPLIMESETDDSTVYMSFADDEMIYVYDGTTHAAFAGDIAVYVGTNNDTGIDSDDDGWCVLTTNESVLRNPVKAGSKTNSAVIGNRATAIGMNSIAYGTATANSNLSLAGGAKSEANGTGSIAIGNYVKTNSSYSVALGSRSETNAAYSVTLGMYTKTEGAKAIAAGNHSEANGDSSVAIGYYSIAVGDQSAAFGWETYAGGDYSLATGMNTSANGDVQFVSGMYNIKDTNSEYAVIVGNGEDEDVKDANGNITTQNRSNAYTLDWEGNGWFAGKVSAGQSTTDEDEDLVLVSKDYLKSYVESYVESAIKEAFNITESDEGKVLKVVDGKAVWVENEFPEVKAEDEGRYLQIVNGAPTWVELDYQNAEEVAY